MLFSASLLVVAFVVAGALLGHYVWTTSPPAAAPFGPSGLGAGASGTSGVRHSSAPGAPPNAPALARATAPALVDVETSLSYLGEQGAGTGIVLGSSGEVLTNNHVVEGATSIRVRDVGNGTAYRARVVGYDRSKDVAVLHVVGASGLTTARIGSSANLQLGEGVVAVGNAGGLGGTPSYAAGSVTGLHQAVSASDAANGGTEHLSGLIETNADVVPGDSGGALVDATGKVVGMVTAGSASFRFHQRAGQGFAIPIDEATRLASEVHAGRARPGVHLGATAFLGVEVGSPPSGGGAAIVQVLSGGPAARSPLRAGDTIVALDGHRVTSPDGLTRALLTEHPGASVRVGYRARGGRRTTTVTLASGPPQ